MEENTTLQAESIYDLLYVQSLQSLDKIKETYPSFQDEIHNNPYYVHMRETTYFMDDESFMAHVFTMIVISYLCCNGLVVK